MNDTQFPRAALTRPARAAYRAELLHAPETRDSGVAHQVEGTSQLLSWSQVRRALAAEVGEPEGVRTIVFDLVTEIAAAHCLVCRFNAEPGAEAREVASAIVRAIGPERCDAALKNAATDGYPERWFPDLETFEEAVLESLDPPPAVRDASNDPTEQKSWGQRAERDKDKEWAKT